MRYCVWLLALSACSRTTLDFRQCQGSCAAIAVLPSNPVVTAGKTLQLSAQVVGDSSEVVSFRLLDPAGGSITSNGVYSAPATPGTYSIEADAAGAKGVINIVVAPVPVTPLLDAGRAAVTANGGPYSASVTAPIAGLVYTWSVSGGALASAAVATSVNFTAAQNGVVLLSVQVVNAAGDSAAPGELGLNIVPPLTAPILDVPAAVTAGRSDLVAFVSNPQDGATYNWQQTEGGLVTAISSTAPSVSFSSGTAGDLMTVAVQETTAAGDISDWVSSAAIPIFATGVSVIAGVPGGTGDIGGNGTTARFWFESSFLDAIESSGIAADATGSLYVSSTASHVIKKIAANGDVSVLSGVVGGSGDQDGPPGQDPLIDAVFLEPAALAVGGNTLYVGEYYDDGSANAPYCAIRTVDLTPGATLGTSHTLYDYYSCGSPGAITALAVGTSATDLFVIQGTQIARVDASKKLAAALLPAWNNPSAPLAPYLGAVYDSFDNTLLAAGGDHLDKYSTGCSTTPCARTSVATTFNANYGQASGVAIDNLGNVFVALQYGISYLAKSGAGFAAPVDVAGGETSLPAVPFWVWPADGTGASALFAGLTGLVFANGALFGTDVNTDSVFIDDDSSISTVREISAAGQSKNSGVVTTFAGLPRSWGNADAPLGDVNGVSPARFANVVAAAVDGHDNIFVGDCNVSASAPMLNAKIREVSFAGVVQSVAGDGNSGLRDGVGSAAELTCPRGLTLAPSGDLIFADPLLHTVSGMTPEKLIYPIAGAAGTPGYQDGLGAQANFDFPLDTKVDSAGNIFVADSFNCAVREIFPNGIVTTFLDLSLNPGVVFPAGDPAVYDFGGPEYCPADSATSLAMEVRAIVQLGNDWLISVYDNAGAIAVIERVSLNGGAVTVTPVIGCQSPVEQGSANASGPPGSCQNNINTAKQTFMPSYNNTNSHAPCLTANIAAPTSLLVAPDGSVFIADVHVLQRVTNLGQDNCEVNTIAGSERIGVETGAIDQANFNFLRGLALTRSGDIVAVDEGEGVVLLVRYN